MTDEMDVLRAEISVLREAIQKGKSGEVIDLPPFRRSSKPN
jgi:hypothetical protein